MEFRLVLPLKKRLLPIMFGGSLIPLPVIKWEFFCGEYWTQGFSKRDHKSLLGDRVPALEVLVDRIRWNGLFCRSVLIRAGTDDSQSTFCLLFWERPALNFRYCVRGFFFYLAGRRLPLEFFEMCYKATANASAMCIFWTARTLFSYEVMLRSDWYMTSVAKQWKITGHPQQVTLAKLYSTDGFRFFFFVSLLLLLLFLPGHISQTLKCHFHSVRPHDYLGCNWNTVGGLCSPIRSEAGLDEVYRSMCT